MGANRKRPAAEPILRGYGEVDDAIREWGAVDSMVAEIARRQQDAIDKGWG